MTKKDYELIATAIRQARMQTDPREHHVITRVAEEIGIKLSATNPRFNRNRFLNATY